MPQPENAKRTALAIFAVFFFEAAVLGQWIPRIPDIKSNLGLSDAQLGLALLSLPFGTVIGLSLSGKIIQNIGLRDACRVFLPLWSILFIGPALSASLEWLMFALVLSGVAIGIIETAMNTEAARIETALGKRLMSRCHGFWSIGTMFGALLGGLIAQQGVSVSMHFLMVLPLLALGGFWFANNLPVVSKVKTIAETSDKSSLVTLPPKALLLLCVMPLGVMMVEGAFIDWSAVFMRDIMSASPLVIAVTYSFFSIVMAAVRLSGDAISERFEESSIVRFSALAAMLGIGLFALAPNILVAFVAAAIAGSGVAIVFPLAVTAAANRPTGTPAENVASLNMIAFTAFLIAPPFIGFLSDMIGLRFALLALVPFALLSLVLAKEVRANI